MYFDLGYQQVLLCDIADLVAECDNHPKTDRDWFGSVGLKFDV